jgi:predicted TIM-barrel enzyme
VVAHGGPFPDAASVQTVFDRVDVDGFLGASSIERLPVEAAIVNTVKAHHALRFRS